MAEGTYSDAQLTVRDQIRGTIGDIGPTFDLSDVALDSIVTRFEDARLATAEAADQLASIYLKRVQSFSRGGKISASWADRAGNLRKLAVDLRTQVRDDAAAARSGLQSLAPQRVGRTHGEYRRDYWEV